MLLHSTALSEAYKTTMKLSLFLLLGVSSALVTVPQPEGQYGVSRISFQLNDTKRRDPYTGKPFRVLPVTLMTPVGLSSACQPIALPYMSNATARYWEQALEQQYKIPLQNTFNELRLSLCKPRKTEGQFPLIVFSQGLGFPAEFYSILTTNLAAQGYAVVQVGIPGEISFIQFPDGQVERGTANVTDGAQHAAALDVRVDDISFVLDQLSSLNGDVSCLASNINRSSPSIFGHSFGGATALATVISDERFAGGINEDGAFWGKGLIEQTDRPFMILASTPNYTRSLLTVPNWAETWPHLGGLKWLVSIENSTHNSFVDIALIAEYSGFLEDPGVKQLLGKVDPKEMLKIQVALLSEMARFLNGMAGEQGIITTAAGLKGVDVLNKSSPGITK